jgi:type III secretion system HrpB2-like protein
MSDAILPVGPAAEVAKKALDSRPASGPSMEELTQRFQTLMSQPASEAHADGTPNAVGEFLTKQEARMKNDDAQLQALQANAAGMGPEELMAATMHINRSVSVTDFKLKAANSLASAANKSLQSLLKN